MAHPLLVQVQTDEKREKRLDSLEQRAVEVENKLLRTSNSALEKRVAELEASLKESNEECNKLRQTISHMKSAEKDVIPSKKEDIVEVKNGLICKNDVDNFNNDEISDVISSISKEEEIIYERILKLVENMKSDCQKAINMKIPTESQLPMRPTRQGSKSSASKSPSPTDGLISPSKMIGRSWTPNSGISVITSSIPTSRAVTPSGAISPPTMSRQIPQIPTKSPGSPNKASQLPSRSNTPSGIYSPTNFINHIPVTPVTSLNKKQRQRTGSCCSNIPSRPNTPPPSTIHATGIPSHLPQKMQCRRQITC
ncbi:hypothetical protein C1645_817689 [Glomus cerebriforme]|uniref:Uncharacterized protein n=1 Tax=Glomus cerebriforme TaxID=658196 RepID=A0A397TBC3_9GLOM|nr:hypothetical protein C1645_817689 [Glomus cerebriforme]